MSLLYRLRSFDRQLVATPWRLLLMALPIAALTAVLEFPVYLIDRIYYNPLLTLPEFLATSLAASVFLFLTGSAIASFLIIQGLIFSNYLKFFFLREGLIPSDFVNWHEAFIGAGLLLQIFSIVAISALLAISIALASRRHLLTRAAGLAVWTAIILFAYARPQEVKAAVLAGDTERFWLVSSEFQQRGFFLSFASAAVEARRLALEMDRFPLLDRFPPGDLRTARIPPSGPKPDIHIVLLESFVDPADLTKLTFEPDPIPSRIADLVARNKASSYSSVFGGKTAKPEFEVLCGIPDFDLLGVVTFNQMGESPADCLPRILGRAGYATMASTPLPGSFFNIKHAYKSLGFQERLFSESFVYDDMDGAYLTNASTLRQNLGFVRTRLAAAPERPLLNYLVLLGGHFPFDRNEERRPARIRTSPDDPILGRLVNMSHYTLAAIQVFLAGIDALGRDSIVVLFGDHLPPIPDEELQKAGYRGFDPSHPITARRTFLLVLRNGKPVPVGNITQYEIADVLLRQIAGGCDGEDCAIDEPLMLRPPGAYRRAAPGEALCQETAQEPAATEPCRTAALETAEMRRVYQHIVRQSRLPDGAPVPPTAPSVAGVAHQASRMN